MVEVYGFRCIVGYMFTGLGVTYDEYERKL
jgi:hypothetical protein